MISITQNMRFRQSLMKYAQRFGVVQASRKYNKSKSYIYFGLKRYDGSIESLACQSRRPHSHPNAHTEAELKLIRDMHRRNPNLGLVKLWHRLRLRGCSRCVESLYRVMCKLDMFPVKKEKKKYVPKPYQQMAYPGERVQASASRSTSRSSLAVALQTPNSSSTSNAIDEVSCYRVLGAYDEHSTFSSTDFLKTVVRKFARLGIRVELCTDRQRFRVYQPFLRLQARSALALRGHRR